MRTALTMVLVSLISGCGISVSTSGLKAGVIAEDTKIEGDSIVRYENIIGLKLQWAPPFSATDVKKWIFE